MITTKFQTACKLLTLKNEELNALNVLFESEGTSFKDLPVKPRKIYDNLIKEIRYLEEVLEDMKGFEGLNSEKEEPSIKNFDFNVSMESGIFKIEGTDEQGSWFKTETNIKTFKDMIKIAKNYRNLIL